VHTSLRIVTAFCARFEHAAKLSNIEESHSPSSTNQQRGPPPSRGVFVVTFRVIILPSTLGRAATDRRIDRHTLQGERTNIATTIDDQTMSIPSSPIVLTWQLATSVAQIDPELQ
jgi:hypothetical protein